MLGRNFRRFASTAAIPKTQISTLSNGLTVATEIIPNTSTATVGMWIDAGSRADHPKSSGTAHFLEHLAFKGTTNRQQIQIETEIEDIGAHLNAYTSRENTVYYAKAIKQDIPKVVDILSDILTRSSLKPHAIELERDVIIRESEEVDKMYDEVVFDHLHATAFKSQPLGKTILGPRESILTIQQSDLKNYIQTNYKGDRMVLVGTGAVEHEDLVKCAEDSFGHIKISDLPLPIGSPRGDLPTFYGEEIRIHDTTLPTSQAAIAIEGVSWVAPDYFTALVTQAIVGNWDRALGTGSNSPSQLAVTASTGGFMNQPVANSYMSFTTSYADTGLWGIYFTYDKSSNPKILVDAILKEWARLRRGDISEEEVERAKAQLKASLLLSLDGSTAIAEDIGRQLVTTGHRMSPEEVFERVDKITKNDVVNWANYRLKDKKVALAALGDVEDLPSHKEICNGMSI